MEADNNQNKNENKDKSWSDFFQMIKKQARRNSITNVVSLLMQAIQLYDFAIFDDLLAFSLYFLADIFKNWNHYFSQYFGLIQKFMNLLATKMQKIKYSFVIKQNFDELVKMYEKNTKVKIKINPTIKLELMPIEHLAQEHYNILQTKYTKCKGEIKNKNIQFEKEKVEKSEKVIQKKGPEALNKQKQVNNFIDTFGGLNKKQSLSEEKDISFQTWKQIFYKIELAFNYLKRTKNIKNLQNIIKNIENFEPSCKTCLCCTTFFYQNQDINYFKSQQNVCYLPTISKLADYKQNISEAIIGLLNASGGIILVGCRKQGYKILPNCDQITEKTKSNRENKINAILSKIKPEINRDFVRINFVPVAKTINTQNNIEHQWLKGTFVLRICVISLKPEQLYYGEPSETCLNIFKKQKNQIVKLKREDIYDFMKIRFKMYGKLAKGLYKECGYSYPCFWSHIKDCNQPEKGQVIYNTNNEIDEDEIQISQKKKTNKYINDDYKFHSLLVIDKDALKLIRQTFGDDKCDAIIQQAFPDCKFKLSNNTFLVRHNCKYEKLDMSRKKNLNDLKSKNNKKQPILINTTSCLRVKDKRLTKNQIDQIDKYVGAIIKQKIQHKEIHDSDYYRCGNVITAVFVYFKLKDMGIKSEFTKLPQGNASKKHISKEKAGKGIKKIGKIKTTEHNTNQTEQIFQERTPNPNYYNQYQNHANDDLDNEAQYENRGFLQSQSYQYPSKENYGEDTSTNAQNQSYEIKQNPNQILYQYFFTPQGHYIMTPYTVEQMYNWQAQDYFSYYNYIQQEYQRQISPY